jgi:ABC-type glycerol-3-phosphate transport system substrate-binding protein
MTNFMRFHLLRDDQIQATGFSLIGNFLHHQQEGGRIMKRVALVVCLALVLGMMSFAWGAEKKVVRIWHTETEPQSVAAFQQIITDFEKQNPDITVKQEALAWGDLEAKLTAALAAGSPPDASHGQAVTCASFYAKGLLREQEDIADPSGGITSGRPSGGNATMTINTTGSPTPRPPRS